MTINQQLAISYGLFALALVLLAFFILSSLRDMRRAPRFEVSFSQKHRLYSVMDTKYDKSVGTFSEMRGALDTVNALNEADSRGAI